MPSPDKEPWKPVFMTFFSVFVLPLTAAIWHARHNIWQVLIFWAGDGGRRKVDNNHLWPDQTYWAASPPPLYQLLCEGWSRALCACQAILCFQLLLLIILLLLLLFPLLLLLLLFLLLWLNPHQDDNGKRVPPSARYLQTMIWLNFTALLLRALKWTFYQQTFHQQIISTCVVPAMYYGWDNLHFANCFSVQIQNCKHKKNYTSGSAIFERDNE